MSSAYAAHVASMLLASVPPAVVGPTLSMCLLLAAWRWFDQHDELRVLAVQDAVSRSRTALGAL